MSSKGEDAAYLFVGMLIGIGSYFYGLALYRIYKLIQYTPTSKSVSAAPGICEVTGIAQPDGELQTAPFAKKACVFFKTNIYKWSGSGKHRSRSLAKCLEGHNRFYLQDDSGRIAINPPQEIDSGSILKTGLGMASKRRPIPQNYLEMDVSESSNGITHKSGFNAKTMLAVIAAMIVAPILAIMALGSGDSVCITAFLIGGLIAAIIVWRNKDWFKSKPKKTQAEAKPIGAVKEFLRESYPSLANYGDRIDVEETYIEPGDQIYVLGTATAAEGDPDAISVGLSPDNDIFCISDGSEKEARGKAGWNAYLFGLGGPLLFGACAVMLFQAYVKGDFGNWLTDLVPPIMVLMYAGFLLMNILELYNGTIRLRQNIDRANANVNALYQMRYELVPKLIEVVQAAARHERGLQERLAQMRAMQIEQAGKTLVAVAENYPVLQANQNFLTLQKQLADIQEKIAGSQAYLVDATTLYNERVQSFPYFLFAPMMGLKTLAMPQFGAS